MALNRGRMFAAALFAGALLSGQPIVEPPITPVAPVAAKAAHGGGNHAAYQLQLEDEARAAIEREDEEILAVIMAAVTSGALNG